mgnify:CR=1 FL=1
MSRMYEMTVEIKNHKTGNLKKIIRACREEWSFEADDFSQEKTDPLKRRCDKLIATAQESLCGGETEQEFADRLARAIWKANGGCCEVSVQAMCLENPPYESYTFDEEDYERMTKR